jgi:Ca2+-binding RTX toxin-like protein
MQAGNDTFFGQAGNDTLYAVDGYLDHLSCGGGAFDHWGAVTRELR